MKDIPVMNQQRRTLLPVEGAMACCITFLASAVRPSLKSTQAWVSR